ncbi:hypothetical protein FKM82_029096 [Ascaphus truei]
MSGLFIKKRPAGTGRKRGEEVNDAETTTQKRKKKRGAGGGMREEIDSESDTET